MRREVEFSIPHPSSLIPVIPKTCKNLLMCECESGSENKKSELLALALALTLFVVPSGLEPDQALKNCPLGNFSEGDRLPRWPSDPESDELNNCTENLLSPETKFKIRPSLTTSKEGLRNFNISGYHIK